MIIKTKAFGEVEITEDKIITFPGGIIGFPDLKRGCPRGFAGFSPWRSRVLP